MDDCALYLDITATLEDMIMPSTKYPQLIAISCSLKGQRHALIVCVCFGSIVASVDFMFGQTINRIFPSVNSGTSKSYADIVMTMVVWNFGRGNMDNVPILMNLIVLTVI